MGDIVTAREFMKHGKKGLLRPIILCGEAKKIESNAVAINGLLAYEIERIDIKQRTRKLENCLIKVLSNLPEDAALKDFDVLFNPTYKIDVLGLFISVCRVKSFSLLWPGTFDKGKLIYAEPGFQDYKTYVVKSYDITCVI